MLAAIAHPIADVEKRTAESIIVFLRPNLSLRTPAKMTPAIDPTNAQPTYHPLCIADSWNWAETCETVPEITAVS